MAALVNWELLAFSAFPKCDPQNHERSKEEYCAPKWGPLADGVGLAFGALEQVIVVHKEAINALATVAIAIFTYTLWRATNRLWDAGKEQGRTAQLAAEAARDTADSYMMGECAHIHPSVPDLGHFFPSGAYAMYPADPNTPLPRVHLSFANVGKTYGVIHVLRGEIAIGDLPSRLGFTYSKERRDGSILVRPNTQTDPIPFDLNRNLTIDEINEIGVGTTPIFVFGYVLYMDIFGYYHGRSFCFRVQRGRNASVQLAGGSEYNYRTKTKMPEQFQI